MCENGHTLMVSTNKSVKGEQLCGRKHYKHFKGKKIKEDTEIANYA